MPIYYSWRTVPFSLLCLFIFLLSVFPFFSRQVARVRCSLSTQNQLPTWLTIFSRLAVQNTSLLENTARKPATREAPLHKKKKKTYLHNVCSTRVHAKFGPVRGLLSTHTTNTSQHRNELRPKRGESERHSGKKK